MVTSSTTNDKEIAHNPYASEGLQVAEGSLVALISMNRLRTSDDSLLRAACNKRHRIYGSGH